MREVKSAPRPTVRASGPFVCIDRATEQWAQVVRLFDVVLLGPAMIWASRRTRGIPSLLLLAAGFGTIYYNGRNYLLVRSALAPPRSNLASSPRLGPIFHDGRTRI